MSFPRPAAFLLLAGTLLALAPAAAAQEEAAAPPAPLRMQAVTVQPLHAILGYYSAAYERVLGPTTTAGFEVSRLDWDDDATYTAAEATVRYYPSADALNGLSFGMILGPSFGTDVRYQYDTFGGPPVPVNERFTALGFGFEIARSHILGVDRRFHYAYGAGAKRLVLIAGDHTDSGDVVLPMLRLSVGFAF
jgi:hypothetical protein